MTRIYSANHRLWLIAGIIFTTVNSQANCAESTTSLILEKPLPVDKKADEITQLLVERRNASVELLQAHYALFTGGKGSFESVVAAAERTLRAQLEVSDSNKLQILEQHVKFATDLSGMVNERFHSGVTDVTTQRAANCLRLEMQLRLAREKQNAKNKAG